MCLIEIFDHFEQAGGCRLSWPGGLSHLNGRTGTPRSLWGCFDTKTCISFVNSRYMSPATHAPRFTDAMPAAKTTTDTGWMTRGQPDPTTILLLFWLFFVFTGVGAILLLPLESHRNYSGKRIFDLCFKPSFKHWLKPFFSFEFNKHILFCSV